MKKIHWDSFRFGFCVAFYAASAILILLFCVAMALAAEPPPPTMKEMELQKALMETQQQNMILQHSLLGVQIKELTEKIERLKIEEKKPEEKK